MDWLLGDPALGVREDVSPVLVADDPEDVELWLMGIGTVIV